MNFVQLTERARQEFGASGQSITTVQEPLADEIRRLRNWISTAWMEIQNLHDDWEFMRISGAYVMGVGATALSPPEYIAGDVRSWREDTFRWSQPGGGFQASQPIVYQPYDTFMRTSALSTSVGAPNMFTVRPKDKAILIAPAADKAYEIYYDYQRASQVLTLDTDAPTNLPTEHHLAIVYKAGLKYGRFEAAPEVREDCKQQYNVMIGTMEALFLPQMTVGPNA